MTTKLNINQFTTKGFNRVQATSLAWAEVFEAKQVETEYKYQGRVDGTIRIDTYCFDCKMGGQFIPSTMREFIIGHKGHNTKTMRLR